MRASQAPATSVWMASDCLEAAVSYYKVTIEINAYGCKVPGATNECQECLAGFTYDSSSKKCIGRQAQFNHSGTMAFVNRNSYSAMATSNLSFGAGKWAV